MIIFRTKIHYILLPVIFLITGNVVSQSKSNLPLLREVVKNKNWKVADSLSKVAYTTTLTEQDYAELELLTGEINFNLNSYQLAFELLESSRTYFIKTKNIYKQALSERLMIDCISYLNEPLISNEKLIRSFCDLSNTLDYYDFKCDCQFFKGSLAIENGHYDKAIFHYKNVSKLALENKDSVKYYNNQLNIGYLVGSYQKEPLKSIIIFKEIIPYFKKNEDLQRLFLTQYNMALQYVSVNNIEAAINSLHNADSLPIQTDVLANKQLLYSTLSDVYEKQKKYNLSLSYLKKSNLTKDSLSILEQRKTISEIQTKYQTKEKDLEIESSRRQNKNLLITFIVILFFGIIIFYLIQKNTKRKQKLAEQEKQLESQKLETVLKEQELVTIDAMIEGQEKERQRIANDLHDDLGGLMATVKLHFNALKDKASPELFTKTNNLIEEAYQKVRSVAHAKNSGVIAKQGLLKAVQDMADKVSVSNKIQIDVMDYGLDYRLENSLELTLFRIIQELITNIVKHAEATQAIIHLTNHDDTINIMVEDNGKGFNPSQVTKTNKGMGISSIDKRITHLEGTMTIESEPNNGTTIIIDIPLNTNEPSI